MTRDDTLRGGPVLFDIGTGDEPAAETPSTAAPVGEDPAAEAAAMATLAHLAARDRSVLGRWFLGLGAALVSAFFGMAAWAAVAALMQASPVLAGAMTLLLAAFLLVAVILVLRELWALSRLSRLDRIHQAAAEVLARGDLEASRKLALNLGSFYAGRRDLEWSAGGLEKAVTEHFDADAVLGVTERALVAPLDQRAVREVEAAARQVATVTALVPLALADLVTALVANLRMIRRIAEIYGGRAGVLGAWRLTRAVLTHLVATGALAVGDDLIGSVAGGGLVSRVSRRFGEGVVNGALTARVGVAAIEVCRPLPFLTQTRPSVTRIVQRSLRGLFSEPGARG
ncbi:YcjF family protein [Poseidonocella sp. HB161398]|uniref:YcjF family protein n=1 Tax=Poseidonocella sp. HB161398 TaxID=2320855 RepID=UPI001107AD6C|nr:TIGR01620 family protein [Poseidonocella sp. HB161398]